MAKEGSLARAAGKLHVSQPSISEQIRELEGALGEKLFRREGRNNKLTDTRMLVFNYADEIFALGRELMNSVKHRPGLRALRLNVGVADSFPKLVTNEILKPACTMPQAVHVICREGKRRTYLHNWRRTASISCCRTNLRRAARTSRCSATPLARAV